MIHPGSIVEPHDGSAESARRILTYLRDKPPVIMHTEHEVAAKNLPWDMPWAKIEDDEKDHNSVLAAELNYADEQVKKYSWNCCLQDIQGDSEVLPHCFPLCVLVF